MASEVSFLTYAQKNYTWKETEAIGGDSVSSSGFSTWSVYFKYPSTFVVSGSDSTFHLPTPEVYATWTSGVSASSKNAAWISIPLNIYDEIKGVWIYRGQGNSFQPIMYSEGRVYNNNTSTLWIQRTTKKLGLQSMSLYSYSVSDLFNSSNKNDGYVEVSFSYWIGGESGVSWTDGWGDSHPNRYVYMQSYALYDGEYDDRSRTYVWPTTTQSQGAFEKVGATSRIYLDAPPSGSAYPSQSSYDYGSAVTISASGSAQYGGDVSRIDISVGGQTRTIYGPSGSVSFTGLNSGTYYPDVSIRDSRGQVSSASCSGFTVKAAPAPAFTPSGPSTTAFDLGDTYTANSGNITCYGGASVSSVVLKVGSQTVSRSSSGSLSLNLNAVGQFTPTITVTDSNGRSTSKNLSTITVKNTNIYVSDLSAHRIEATGAWSDSGESCYVEAKFTVQNSTFQSPIVKVDNVTTATSWYTAYDKITGFSNAVSNWATVSSGTTLYGKVGNTGAFSKDASYTIGVTPRSVADTGGELRVFLPKEFFLLAGKAGGRGLGVGQKPNAEELQVAMIARFFNDVYVPYDTGQVVPLLDYIYPVGSYYETSKTPSEFNPNDYWGGEWVQDTIGKVLVGKGTGYTTDGGSNSQTVPVPYHRHSNNSLSVSTSGNVSVSGTGSFSGQTGTEGAHTHNMKWRGDQVAEGKWGGRILAWDTTVTQTTNKPTSAGSDHSHSFSGSVTVNSSGSNSMSGTATGATSYEGTSGATMSVMQEYVVVYRWHRTK